MASPSRRFYKDLPAVAASEGMCDVSHHRPVPDDWCVVVTDIVASTAAIERGQYKDVNMVSASAITAVVNATDRQEIAYIFGGDGATLLIPAELAFDVAGALYGTRLMAREAFNLEMRAGIISVEDLRKKGAGVRVARTEISPGVCLAAMSGEGITLAEKLVKSRATAKDHDVETLFSPRMLAMKPPSFRGLECRWQPLQSRKGINVSLIILAREGDDAAKAALYGEILERIGALCGSWEDWRPVSDSQLNLSARPERLKGEAKVRTTGQKPWRRLAYLSYITVLTLGGKLLMATGLKAGSFDGRKYRNETARNSDYIKFDNALRLIMDLTAEQKAALEQTLEAFVADGRIFYGLHAASQALMTCLVFDYGNHVHFVDGADGGYALAAKAMKQQMAAAAQEKAA
jgi:hypothetical protein